jgi:hypothetical protein
MSNKPLTDPSLHDATDSRCVNHTQAMRSKGIKANKNRTCPACFIAKVVG